MLKKPIRIILFPFRRINVRSTRSVVLAIILLQAILSVWLYDNYFKTNIDKNITISDQHSGNATKPTEKQRGNLRFDSNLTSFTKPILDLLSSLSSNSKNKLPNAATLYKKMVFDTSPTWIDEYYLNSNLLTVPMGTDKNKQLKSIEDLTFYDSDPRLTWSVYLYHILQNSDKLSTSNGDNDFRIPFSWYDFIDFHNYNKLVSIKDKFKDQLSCKFATSTNFDKDLLHDMEVELDDAVFTVDRQKYEDKFWYRTLSKFDSGIEREVLSDICLDSTMQDHEQLLDQPFNLPFKIKKIWTKLRPEMYQIHARNFILNTLSHPLSLTILESNRNAYQLNLEQSNRSNMVQSKILSQFIEDNKKGNDMKFDHIKIFEQFIQDTKVNQNLKIEIPQLDQDIYQKDKIELSLDDFKFDIKTNIEELEALDKEKKLSNHQKNYLNSLKNSYQTHPALAPKYLAEAADLQGNAFGHHRDQRFYNDAIVDNGIFKASRMNSLIRNFQKLINNNGLISWLSHGTLYGHLYDGLAFPWDNDFDLQMPLKHLHLLAQYYNQSLILEDPREGNGRFFLDVTSSISVRTNANGKNNIDARFVDVDSGLYIDITGLSVSSARYKKDKTDIIPTDKYNDAKEEILKAEIELPNPEIGVGLASKSLEDIKLYVEEHSDTFDSKVKEAVEKMISEENNHQTKDSNLDKGLTETQRYFLNDKLNLVNCRNSHFNRLDMISPLRISYFHGVRAFVPNKVIESLQNEYKVPKKYGFQSFEGKTYLPKLKQWILFPILKRIANVNDLYQNMLPLDSQISALSFPDVKKILVNMIRGGYLDLFSITTTTFDVTNYRIKELELMFDSKLSIKDKNEALAFLRDNIGPKIRSPMKDALLLDYEYRLWKYFEKSLAGTEVDDIKELICYDMVNELSRNFTIFNSRHWFNNILAEKDGDQDKQYHLDKVGLKIYDGIENEINEIFEHDPEY